MRPYTKEASPYYERFVEYEVKLAASEVRFMRKLFGKKVKRVLEAACGTGRLTQYLAKYYDVVGIDITPAMMNEAKKKKIKAKFVVADMRTYKNKKKFDAVIVGSNTVCYLKTKKAAVACFKNFKRNLRKGGFVVFDLWDASKWKNMTYTKKRKGMQYYSIVKGNKFYWHDYITVDGKKIHMKGTIVYYPPKEWERLLALAGFETKVYQRKDKAFIVGVSKP